MAETPNDPTILKYAEEIKELQRKMRARCNKIKEQESKLAYSAKLSVAEFLLSEHSDKTTLEGLKSCLASITRTDKDDNTTTSLERYERYLKDDRLREAFGFPKIQKDEPEE